MGVTPKRSKVVIFSIHGVAIIIKAFDRFFIQKELPWYFAVHPYTTILMLLIEDKIPVAKEHPIVTQKLTISGKAALNFFYTQKYIFYV